MSGNVWQSTRGMLGIVSEADLVLEYHIDVKRSRFLPSRPFAAVELLRIFVAGPEFSIYISLSRADCLTGLVTTPPFQLFLVRCTLYGVWHLGLAFFEQYFLTRNLSTNICHPFPIIITNRRSALYNHPILCTITTTMTP